ncbi:MAG: alpha-L-fucosidase [Caldilineaceae bacterium]
MLRTRIPVADYEPLAAQFNPTQFDAAAWVALAKAAGQKHIVITAKHHDGFSLPYPRRQLQHGGGNALGRDVIKELADECQKQEMPLGFYYSQTQDWHHPNGDGNDWDFDEDKKDFQSYIDTYVKPHVRQLLTEYGPVAIIWFDTPKGITHDQSQALLDLCNELQPDCLVCGRLGNTLGDYASARDNQIPGHLVQEVDWETPATINDTWGYKANDHNWKSTTELIHKLVDIVSKGGNYLLNVGPTAAGEIPKPSIERLQEMGAWLAVNGEAIYGARPGPIQGEASVPQHAQGQQGLFCSKLNWPTDGQISVNYMGAAKAYLLADSAEPTALDTSQRHFDFNWAGAGTRSL